MLKDKESIRQWLEKYHIKSYVINPDLSVDVNQTVIITDAGLTEIPIQFNDVHGTFNISRNLLTSLKGCPRTLGLFNNFATDFDCSDNKLESLEYCPQFITGSLVAANNKLTSLVGGPQVVSGSYVVSENKLKSLVGSPIEKVRSYNFTQNRVTSLMGITPNVENHIIASKNHIKSLKNEIQSFGGLLYIHNNRKKINNHIGSQDVSFSYQDLINAVLHEELNQQLDKGVVIKRNKI